MKIRRAAVLGLVALAGIVAGCGGSDSNKGAGTSTGGKPSGKITVWIQEKEPDRVATTQAIVDDFTAKTGVKVKLVGVDEDQFSTLVTSASAAGTLPDAVQLDLGAAQTYAAQDILDPGAAQRVIDKLGPSTFAPGALKLIKNGDGKATAVPSDGWGQLLIYRKDLFQQAGLPAPDTLDKLRDAAAKLNKPGQAGITLATTPGDEFTEQSFEYIALAAGCQLVDSSGKVTIDSPQCQDALKRYAELAKYSVKGNQNVDSTRGTYFAGRAAMIIWSPFLLDAMAGLRKDAIPSCPQCKKDPAFLAKNSGFVTAISGSGSPTQYGSLNNWGITADANKPAAEAFVQYMMSDGYVRWMGISPQGKFPLRAGDAAEPKKYVDAWNGLDSGVDKKAPLTQFYDKSAVAALAKGADTYQRWGFEQGQGALIGALSSEQPIPDAVAKVIGGTDAASAAAQAKSAVEQVKASIQ